MPDEYGIYATNCSHPINYGRYIEDFKCLEESGNRLLKEMRLSFPSGHSSFSMYTMLYCAVSTHTDPSFFYRTTTNSILKLFNDFFYHFFAHNRFICNRGWHGKDQSCSNILCSIYYSQWHGSRACRAFRTTNITGLMCWLADWLAQHLPLLL